MKIAIDVQYTDSSALIGGVLFENWKDSHSVQNIVSEYHQVQAYEAGQFYKRELPCILKLIQEHNIKPEVIIIDGYVFLDGISQVGLGHYLYQALKETVPIIGVAKKAFKDISPTYAIYRGQSQNPLYVTSIGMTANDAQKNIQAMQGKYRIPTLLKQADQLCRGIIR